MADRCRFLVLHHAVVHVDKSSVRRTVQSVVNASAVPAEQILYLVPVTQGMFHCKNFLDVSESAEQGDFLLHFHRKFAFVGQVEGLARAAFSGVFAFPFGCHIIHGDSPFYV